MKNYYLPILALALFFICSCRSSIVNDPTTRISFAIAQPSYVKMEIENSYNTVVATPVNEYKPAGIYSASFDASGFPEGIYFYTIECKGVNNTYYSKSTKSMILIK